MASKSIYTKTFSVVISYHIHYLLPTVSAVSGCVRVLSVLVWDRLQTYIPGVVFKILPLRFVFYDFMDAETLNPKP